MLIFRREKSLLPLLRHSSTLRLRDYQQHVIDRCIERIVTSPSRARIGVSLATGGGKTVIFTNLIRQLNEERGFVRPLILAHRRELVMQAAATVKKIMPESNVQVEMGKNVASLDRTSSDLQVVIASVQSLVRRLDNHPRDAFDLIIIDEAHHAVANSYLQILKHFNDEVPVVGFSATFERADNKALSTVMDEIIYHRGILEMINDKWLCEGKFTTVGIDCDLSNVEVSGGSKDFKLDKLSRIMNTEQVNQIVLKTYLHKSAQNNGFKSTLLFAVDIQHVETLYELFQQHKVNAKYVTSNTPTEKRDQIIKDFKSGEIQVLINCGIFTEGTDMPNIDCILLCRPTRSRSLLIQMIGRGLRLHHSKKHCHIIDFVGASNVGVVSVPTLAGLEHFEGNLEDATLKELQMIKDDLAFKQNEKLETEKVQQESFRKWMANVSSFDLTLSSFDTFEDYYRRHKDPTGGADADINHNSYFRNSVYPWVKFAKDAWGLSLQNGHHLRIYKQSKKQGNEVYTLKLYREIPHFLREDTGTKFIPRELMMDKDFVKVAGKVDEVMRHLTKPTEEGGMIKNLTKFARWRQEPATVKQKRTVKQKLERELHSKESSYSLSSADLTSLVERMTKGEASNVLFASSIAPVYPFRSLLRILDYKKRI